MEIDLRDESDLFSRDVILLRVKGRDLEKIGQESLEKAKELCRRPYPYFHVSDHFVGVDAYGYGQIVCATPSLSNWIGTNIDKFKREVH